MHVHRERAVARLLPFVASTLLLAGCAFIQPAKKPPALEEESRQFYLDRGGPEVLRDVEAVTAKLGRSHALETGCIDDYLSGLGLEQDKKATPAVENEEQTINRYDSCAKQCSQQAQSGLPDIAHKYEQLCTTRGRALKERYFLTALRKDIEKLRAAPDAIHLMVAARGVEHNVEVTKASLGQDDPTVKELVAERDSVLKSRAGDVEKERAFRERPDIKDLASEIDLATNEMRSAKELYQQTGQATLKDLADASERRVVSLNARWDEKAIKAGVLAPAK
jgi:hypothetical protein